MSDTMSTAWLGSPQRLSAGDRPPTPGRILGVLYPESGRNEDDHNPQSNGHPSPPRFSVSRSPSPPAQRHFEDFPSTVLFAHPGPGQQAHPKHRTYTWILEIVIERGEGINLVDGLLAVILSNLDVVWPFRSSLN
ncbi:24.9 kDa protein in picA locus [Penicillium canescens]|nr:24.9 kDa protein in picA locus [Penicillium canescens]